MTIFVTGASGMIGRKLIERLQAERYKVIAPSRGNSCFASIENLTTAIPQPSSVVHLAAGVPNSSLIQDTKILADETLRLDALVLDAAASWGVPVIYTSGCSLYDTTIPLFHNETSPIVASLKSHYLRAKACGDSRYMSYGRATVLRLSRFCGAGVSDSQLSRRFVDAVQSQRSIEIHGDGLDELDLVDLSDVIEAILACIRIRPHGVFNISSGKQVSVGELAEVVCSQLGRARSVKYVAPSSEQVRRYARFDNTCAAKTIGWSPSRNLEQSIKEMTR